VVQEHLDADRVLGAAFNSIEGLDGRRDFDFDPANLGYDLVKWVFTR
jgi:hypothetical protein